jgi:DNA-binding NtrC family response regulator
VSELTLPYPNTHHGQTNAAPAANFGAQVMVVDDDPSMCNFLQSFLETRGYRTVALANAEDAVRRYLVERPAAVILDVMMPGAMDGLQALAAFKKIDREVPVIVLSSHGRTSTFVEAMKLGASHFVNKPFDELELEVPLTNALKQRQLSREVASLREQLQSQSAWLPCTRSTRTAPGHLES